MPAKGRERLSLRAKALALLAGREYSRTELAQRLKSHARKLAQAEAMSVPGTPAEGAETPFSIDMKAVDTLLDEFTERGWLSETRYVEQAVNRLSRRYGPRRVIQSLGAKGVSRESTDAALPYLKAEALTTARMLLARKFRDGIMSPEDRARGVRFLQGRGFDYDVIRKALADVLQDPLIDPNPDPDNDQ